MTDFKPLELVARNRSSIKTVAGEHLAKVAKDVDDCWEYAHLFAAAPELLAACKTIMPLIDQEIEQRKTGGNDEDWKDLQDAYELVANAVAKSIVSQ